MASAAQRKATFDELYAAILALPEGITGEILTDGQIDTMGRPGRGHSRFATRLVGRLHELEDDPAGGWVFDFEREIRFGLTRLAVPDLAGWRVGGEEPTFLSENPVLRVPDWTCEVLSDSTRAKDRQEKLPLYLRCGVGYVWLADPVARQVEVFVAGPDEPIRTAVATGGGVARLPPFEAWPIDLAVLWLPQSGLPRLGLPR